MFFIFLKVITQVVQETLQENYQTVEHYLDNYFLGIKVDPIREILSCKCTTGEVNNVQWSKTFKKAQFKFWEIPVKMNLREYKMWNQKYPDLRLQNLPKRENTSKIVEEKEKKRMIVEMVKLYNKEKDEKGNQDAKYFHP